MRARLAILALTGVVLVSIAAFAPRGTQFQLSRVPSAPARTVDPLHGG
jgi:hypothetical protein